MCSGNIKKESIDPTNHPQIFSFNQKQTQLYSRLNKLHLAICVLGIAINQMTQFTHKPFQEKELERENGWKVKFQAHCQDLQDTYELWWVTKLCTLMFVGVIRKGVFITQLQLLTWFFKLPYTYSWFVMRCKNHWSVEDVLSFLKFCNYKLSR